MKELPAALLARMLQVQSAVMAEQDVARIMKILTDAALELRNTTAAAIELAEGEDMVYRAASGNAAAYLGLRLKLASSFSGLCVRTSQVLICHDSETDERVDRVATRKVGVRSMIVVPLRTGEETIGAFKLMSDQPGAFTESDAQLLQLMAGFVANAMHNAAALERARQESLYDALTGLANRSLFADRVRRQLARLKRNPQGAAAVIYLDLDGFKPVNDRYGHPAGDELLVQVGERLRIAARETDTVARLGGDEFAVLAADLGAAGDAQCVAERFQRAVEAPAYRLEAGEARIGASTGYSVAEAGKAATVDELLGQADQAMYREKRRRRQPAAGAGR